MREIERLEGPLFAGRSILLVTLVGLGAYLALDRLSFLEAFRGLAITPWSPGAGLTLAFVLLAGWRAAGVALIAPPLAGILVRSETVPAAVHLLDGMMIGGSYLLVGLLVRRYGDIDPRLQTIRDVGVLMLTALAASTVAAFGYVGVLSLSGILEPPHFLEGFIRFFVGDLIGILIVTPTCLLAATRRLNQPLDLETLGQLSTLALAFAAIFLIPHASEFQLFYLLFVPLLWNAFRNGVSGAVVSLCVIQIGLIAFVKAPFTAEQSLISFQILMIWLAATGLVFGALVVQQRAAAQYVRYQQLALTRALRLRSMGELAAGIAHEVNQPLTSIKALATVLNRELSDQPSVAARVTIGKIRSECDRACGIISATRDALRHQAMNPGRVVVDAVLSEVEELMADRLAALGIRLEKSVESGAAVIAADRVQISQALYNLLDNSVQAIEETARSGCITVRVRRQDEEHVAFEVEDNGHGFQVDFLECELPLYSTREHGTGLGLAVASSVAEAHGGRLTIDRRKNAASVVFTIATPHWKEHVDRLTDR